MQAFAASAATAVATAQDVAAQTLRRSIDSSERERSRWRAICMTKRCRS